MFIHSVPNCGTCMGINGMLVKYTDMLMMNDEMTESTYSYKLLNGMLRGIETKKNIKRKNGKKKNKNPRGGTNATPCKM